MPKGYWIFSKYEIKITIRFVRRMTHGKFYTMSSKINRKWKLTWNQSALRSNFIAFYSMNSLCVLDGNIFITDSDKILLLKFSLKLNRNFRKNVIHFKGWFHLVVSDNFFNSIGSRSTYCFQIVNSWINLFRFYILH